MPLFYSQTIDPNTRLAIWHITEDESFFLEWVPLSRQITHAHKRLQHLAGRFLLQYLFPDFPLHLIQVANTRRPYLPEESHHFSISHCGPFAAAIVSTQKRVGIDIEQQTERMLHILPKFLNQKERSLVQPHATDQLINMATLLWSAKEAMFKWYSLGEIDFKQHLLIENIKFIEADAGIILANFCKFESQPLQLHFKCWDEVILTFLAV
jgi:4'-phosphopantetheinyl transferase EntD